VLYHRIHISEGTVLVYTQRGRQKWGNSLTATAGHAVNILIEFLFNTSLWIYRSDTIGLVLVHSRVKQFCGILDLESPT
jgi:hypothetical protein